MASVLDLRDIIARIRFEENDYRRRRYVVRALSMIECLLSKSLGEDCACCCDCGKGADDESEEKD